MTTKLTFKTNFKPKPKRIPSSRPTQWPTKTSKSQILVRGVDFFPINRTLLLLSRGRRKFIHSRWHSKIHKNSSISPSESRQQAPRSTYRHRSEIKYFFLIEIKPSRISFKSNSSKEIESEDCFNCSKFRDCTHT